MTKDHAIRVAVGHLQGVRRSNAIDHLLKNPRLIRPLLRLRLRNFRIRKHIAARMN